MKLLFLLFITFSTTLYSQYVFGKGFYLGIDANYAKPYLNETNKLADGTETDVTYRGDSRAYGFDLVYAMNVHSYFSLEYKRRSLSVKHQSEFFIYKTATITNQTTTLELDNYRLQYFYFFKRTSIFVGAGLELANVINYSILEEKYNNRLNGLMNLGYKTGSRKVMLMPYIVFASPINNLRTDEEHELNLSEFRLGMKIWFALF